MAQNQTQLGVTNHGGMAPSLCCPPPSLVWWCLLSFHPQGQYLEQSLYRPPWNSSSGATICQAIQKQHHRGHLIECYLYIKGEIMWSASLSMDFESMMLSEVWRVGTYREWSFPFVRYKETVKNSEGVTDDQVTSELVIQNWVFHGVLGCLLR